MCSILPPFSVLGILAIMLLHLGSSLRRHGQLARHSKSCSSTSSPSLAAGSSPTTDPAFYPRLIVFDLDNTLWTPELYTLRQIPQGQYPSADVDVKLFEAARVVLEELSTAPQWKHTKFGVASRTNKGQWAQSLLKEFTVPNSCVPLAEFFEYQEIYTGEKTKHFASIHKQSGIPYEDMLFFDDAKDGKFGNCAPVAALGAMAAHCPFGMSRAVWNNAIFEFTKAKMSGNVIGKVLNAPKSATANNVAKKYGGARPGTITSWKEEKSFGFVRLDSGAEEGKQIFFHKSSVKGDWHVTQGAKVIVEVGPGRNNQPACSIVEPALNYSSSSTASDQPHLSFHTISLPCFSMNQPFASLVAHGFKTLETRNSTVFGELAGKYVALHVGKRTYPDGGVHRAIMRRNVPTAQHNTLSEDEIDLLTSLPLGFHRGHIVAILEIGETFLLEEELRRAPDVELRAVATAEAMGRYLTKVKSATWLRAPGIPIRGQPGVFNVEIPFDMLKAETRLKFLEEAKPKQLSQTEITALRRRFDEILRIEDMISRAGKEYKPTMEEFTKMDQKELIEKLLKGNEAKVDLDADVKVNYHQEGLKVSDVDDEYMELDDISIDFSDMRR